jgi:predicted N-acetyltransferase YhbS
MVAPVQIRSCTPAELPALIALLDQEFIYSKGRSVSLAQRFPTALNAANCPNILLACRGEDIVAAIVIKRFDWIAPERSRRGAMIGMVCTRAAERGQGLASQLLRTAQAQLRADGTAFAVLFTAQPEFYRRLGWTTADCGIFGTYASAGSIAAGCTRAAPDAVEALRLRGKEAYLLRDRESYRTLPLPAERLEIRVSPCRAAYAIYGMQAERAYLYELGGAVSGYAALWQELCAVAHTVYINERQGSASQQWLANVPGIAWREQKLAMWLPLAEPDCAPQFSGWYLPFLDRI